MTDQRSVEIEADKAGSSAADGGDYFYSAIDFRAVKELAQKHRRLMTRGAAAGLALGALYLATSSPLYTAQAQLLIDPALTGVVQDGSALAAAMDSQKIQSEIAVIESEEVSLATIDRLKLAQEPEFKTSALREYLPTWLTGEAAQGEQAERAKAQALLEKFRKRLSVERVGVSYAVDITYSATSPELAAKIANGVAEAYTQFQINTRSEAARVGSEWLAGRVAELRTAMNDASRKMQERRATQNYGIGPVGATRVGAADKTGTDAMSFEDLESTAATYRRVYETFLGTYMATVQRQSFPIAGAKLITRATPPLYSSRGAVAVLLSTLVLGTLGGLLLGFIRDKMSVVAGARDTLTSFFQAPSRQ